MKSTFDFSRDMIVSISLPLALQFEAVRKAQLLTSMHSAVAFTATRILMGGDLSSNPKLATLL